MAHLRRIRSRILPAFLDRSKWTRSGIRYPGDRRQRLGRTVYRAGADQGATEEYRYCGVKWGKTEEFIVDRSIVRFVGCASKLVVVSYAVRSFFFFCVFNPAWDEPYIFSINLSCFSKQRLCLNLVISMGLFILEPS